MEASRLSPASHDPRGNSPLLRDKGATMKTKHSQSKKTKEIKLEIQLDWYELQELVRRLEANSIHPAVEKLMTFLEAAWDMSDEPS